MLYVNGNKVKMERFPDGTFNMTKIKDYLVPKEDNDWYIVWSYECEEENIFLYYLINYIKDTWVESDIELYIPYLPNARMDRVSGYHTEAFTLKYFCNFINSLDLYSVYVLDPHSEVCMALLNKVYKAQGALQSFHLDVLDKVKPNLIYFPDDGAKKRYMSEQAIKEYVKANNIRIAYGNKNRDWTTGKILDLEIHGDVKTDDNVLIIDDISSYGGTFYHSAKKLKASGANKINLCVTHCEENILKGELYKSSLINKVYTTNSICQIDNDWVEIYNIIA